MTPTLVPDTVFHTRIRNPALGGDNPFEWQDITSDAIFAGKRIVLFALPGAFTPACSESHLPGYDTQVEAFTQLGIDEVICTAVNDAFVMHQWAKAQQITNVRMLPDGNGDFARLMGMLVDRRAQGMGYRSWRYSLFVEDRRIVAAFVEPGLRDCPVGVPVTISGAGHMLAYLQDRYGMRSS